LNDLFDEIKRLTVIKSPIFVPEIKLYSVQPFAIKYPYDVDDFNAMFGYPTWSGIALSRFILDNPSMLKDRVVADIGCGSGVVGIAAAKTGAKVTCIDRDVSSLYFTELNFKLNGTEADIMWGNFNDALNYDVVLMSSLFYRSANFTSIKTVMETKKFMIGSIDDNVEEYLEKEYVRGLTKVSLGRDDTRRYYVYHNM
jgi:predicted nicotinamide N-methyase